MNKITNVTIGTDAEVFLRYEDTVISAIGVIGGSKDDPKSIGEGCFVQEDNVLAEFNIPPVTTKEEFIKYINYCKNWIEVNHPELNLHFSSSEMVETFILAEDKAKEFGCEPDSVVDYSSESDDMSQDEYEKLNMQRSASNKRTSGFHIHIGYSNPTQETNRELVKLFEKYVTLPLTLSDIDENDRRSMYGRSGSYRNKDYGVECRSLGGYFIANNDTIGDVWDRVQLVISKFNEGERVSSEEFANIKELINTKQINKIQAICADY